MKLPYAPPTPDPSSPESAEIYARVAARRHPRPLIPLDLALLHSPPVADGWNSFLGAIRSRTVVDPGLLELAICRVAVLNSAVYEWNAHAPLALKGGVLPGELEEVRSLPCTCSADNSQGEILQGSNLKPAQRAVLRYTDQMTRNVAVEDAVFDELRTVGFSDREIVELTATIAGYNCVSRFLVALDVGENNGRAMKEVGELVST